MPDNAITESPPQSESDSKTRISPDEVARLSTLRANELCDIQDIGTLPLGFHYDRQGWLLYQSQQVQNEGEDSTAKPPIRICSRLEVTARTRDQLNENHGRLLEFKDLDGVQHRWAMPMRLLAGDCKGCREELLSKGLLIAHGKAVHGILAMFIQLSSPERTVRCVEQTGWNHDQTVYVLQDGTIGSAGNEEIVLQTVIAPDVSRLSKGTLQDWQELAKLCRGNSKLMFSVSSAFASPLLRLLEVESGGFHLRGITSKGKSTCQNVAVSVWGPRESKVSWRATSNGLEAIAAARNDCFLCLDEIGEAIPHDIGISAYMLANGSGKRRADRAGNSRPHATWRLIFLSSGEVSLSTLMEQVGEKPRAGQEIRILEIPADSHEHGCFEQLHGFDSCKAFVDHLNVVSQRYYGTAGREFVKQLTERKDETISNVKLLMKNLAVRCLPLTANSQVQRAFTRFALVAAAGEVASAYGITGWNEGEASQAVVDTFQEWLRVRGDFGCQEEKAILSHVRLIIEQHGESRFAVWKREEDIDSNAPVQKTINRMGYRKPSQGGDEYYVFPESFRKDFCATYDPVFVAKVLIKNGWLIPGSDGKPTRSERLPGMSNTRVYRITNKVLSDA